MFVYEKNGKSLYSHQQLPQPSCKKNNPVGPSPFWTAKVDFTILAESQKINKEALWRITPNGKATEGKTDRAVIVPEYSGVVMMDRPRQRPRRGHPHRRQGRLHTECSAVAVNISICSFTRFGWHALRHSEGRAFQTRLPVLHALQGTSGPRHLSRRTTMYFPLYLTCLFIAQPAAEITFREKDKSQVEVVAPLSAPQQKLLPSGKLTADQGEAWLRFSLLDPETKKAGPAMLGDYQREGDSLEFRPRFGVEPGRTYRAAFRTCGGASHRQGLSCGLAQRRRLVCPW